MSETKLNLVSPYTIPSKATKFVRLTAATSPATIKLQKFTKINNENCEILTHSNTGSMKMIGNKLNTIPLGENNNQNQQQQMVSYTNPTMGKKLQKITSLKSGGSGGGGAQPSAVARRNARERNRVKQVNNGFAILRQHIPNEVAEAYEAVGGRGAAKKLSKVETLRMAVEYIRSLEKLLDLDIEKSENYSLNSFQSHDDDDEDLMMDDHHEISMDDDLNKDGSCDYFMDYPNVVCINNRQYLCIPGTPNTNTVQLVKLENDENLMLPMVAASSPSSIQSNESILYDESKEYLLDPNLNYNNIHIIPPASISPNSYNSGQSFSPVGAVDSSTTVTPATVTTKLERNFNNVLLLHGQQTPNNEMTSSLGPTNLQLQQQSLMVMDQHDEDGNQQHILNHHHQQQQQLQQQHHLDDQKISDDEPQHFYEKMYTYTTTSITNSAENFNLLANGKFKYDNENNVYVMQGLPPIEFIKKEKPN